MSDVEDRLKSIRDRQAEAQRRHATAEAKLDQVRSERERILAGLKDQGFDTPEDARTAIASMQRDVESILAEIEEKVAGL